MSENVRMFTADEVRYLVGYTNGIVFDAVQAILRSPGSEESREASLRELRLWGRLLAFPELVLEERPKEFKKDKDRVLGVLDRDLFIKVLGRRSSDVVSLSDEELAVRVFRFLHNYQ